MKKNLEGMTVEQKIQAREEWDFQNPIATTGKLIDVKAFMADAASKAEAEAYRAAENPDYYDGPIAAASFSGVGYAFEPLPEYGADWADAAAARREFQAKFGEGNARELAAREREEAEGVPAFERYAARLERALSRSQAFWDNHRDNFISHVKRRNADAEYRGEAHLSPAELQQRVSSFNIDWRAHYQKQLDTMQKASAIVSLTKQLKARLA